MNENKAVFRFSGLAKWLRRAAPAVMTVAAAVLFSACGAKVTTRLEADDGFKGTRTISATLSNEDLEGEINGGAEAIEAVVKKYIPEELSYTSSSGESGLTYTFTFSFDGLEDYRSKLDAILSANPDNSLTAEVNYETSDSIFNQKVFYKENISSIDLLGWLRYGLRTEQTVNYNDEGDWFESGEAVLVLDGQEYEGYDLRADENETYFADSVNVITDIKIDGSMDRTFKFLFDDYTIQRFTEGNVDLDGYFSSLSSVGQMTKSEDEYGNTEYSIKLLNADQSVIAEETKKIVADEDAKFQVALSDYVSEVKTGIRFDITEYADPTYYLPPNNRIVYTYSFPGKGRPLNDENTNVDMFSAGSGDPEDTRDYYGANTPFSFNEELIPTFSFMWEIEFEKVLAELSFSGDNPELAVELYLDSHIMEQVKGIVKSRLEKALCDDIKFSENTVNTVLHPEENEDGAAPVPADYIVYRLDMSGGNSEDVARRYKNYIYNYDGTKTECYFANEKGVSGSPFKSVGSYSAVFDMSSFSADGITDIVYRKSTGENIYVTDNCTFIPYAVQEDGDRLTGTSGTRVEFTAVTESVNIIGIVLCAAAAAAGIALIIIVVSNGKSWLALIKKQAAAMPKYTPPVNAPAPADNTKAPAAEKREPVFAGSVSADEKGNDENGDDEEEFI